MKRIVGLGFVFLAGCVTTSEIVPAGKDSYMVSGSAQGAAFLGESPLAAMKAANAFCAKQGKVMLMRHTQNTSNFNSTASSLLFSCVNENDPEYQRPNYHNDPTTVIEDQRAK